MSGLDRTSVIRLAREAGGKWEQGTERSPYPVRFDIERLLRFAESIAVAAVAEERKACAAMAKAFHEQGYDFTGDLELHEAILAREGR